MRILSAQVGFLDEMPKPDSDLWIDGFDWAAVTASGHSEERAVEVNAHAQVEADRASADPTFDVVRIAMRAVEVASAMREARGWTKERFHDMIGAWAKAYKQEWESRDDLDRFLRRVGQK